jgi:hypothetical protein
VLTVLVLNVLRVLLTAPTVLREHWIHQSSLAARTSGTSTFSTHPHLQHP